MNLKSLRFNLPPSWREISRSGNENQLVLRLYHINPVSQVDSKIFQDQLISSSDTSSVSKIAVSTPSGVGGSYADFFKGMQGFIDSGFAPAHMTSSWLNDFRTKATKRPGAEVPDESDLTGDLSIVQSKTKDIAEQVFQGYASFPLGPFGGPIPGGPVSNGKAMNFMDLMESDALKSVVSKEQLAQMNLLSKEMKKQLPKIQAEAKKTGMKYREEKYLGYRAIFCDMPNPNPPPKPPSPIPKGKFQGGGSRGNNVTIPLPKASTPYSKTISTCQAVIVKNFVVTGGLLAAASFLPPGKTPCYSLKKTEKRTETVEGIKSTYIIASASTYAQEGYLNREEVEKALSCVFSKLKSQ